MHFISNPNPLAEWLPTSGVATGQILGNPISNVSRSAHCCWPNAITDPTTRVRALFNGFHIDCTTTHTQRADSIYCHHPPHYHLMTICLTERNHQPLAQGVTEAEPTISPVQSLCKQRGRSSWKSSCSYVVQCLTTSNQRAPPNYLHIMVRWWWWSLFTELSHHYPILLYDTQSGLFGPSSIMAQGMFPALLLANLNCKNKSI